ncbi:FxsA family protein [Alkanindiges illinoisensis]|uniref:FxsA family protein n=1 Tax=Alkanindiges illinoisensis TaxID=197183 RepID=UPI00047D5FFD|nr:FxsA family protein [Alkanindiges illinoisensis]
MLNPILILLAGIVLEVLAWIGAAQFISGWWIFFWTVIAFVWGLSILRSSVGGIMPQLQQMQMTGQLSGEPQVQQSLPKALAGFLLLLPGLISDVLALLILIPAVQNIVRNALTNIMMKRQSAMMQNMMKGMGGMNTGGSFGGKSSGQPDMMAELMRRMQEMQGQGTSSSAGQAHRPTVIDGEARHVEPDVKKIKPAND